MRIHFFTAPLCLKDPAGLSLFLQSLSQLQALYFSSMASFFAW